MFFKTDAERAAAQAAKARQDAGEAGASAASGARNLGAAVLATLAEVTAPQDDKSGKRHAQRARAKALKAATKDRDSAAKAATKARDHGRKAAGHGKKELDRRGENAGSTLSALTGAAGARATEGAHAAKVQAAHLADEARAKAGPLGESAAEKATAGAALMAALAAAARDKAAETRRSAVLGVDHGIDAAVPRAQEGVAAVAPRVDHLRDVINDELLPKIQAMLGDVQSGKDRVLANDQVAKVTGVKVRQKRKGGTMITLGLLAAAGAGLAWWLAKEQKAPATDPWATPATGTDPWASTAPTAVAPLADPAVRESVLDEPVRDDVSATGTTVTETSVTTGSTDATDSTTFGAEGGPRMLASEEIDELGTEVPAPVEEQGEGETPTEEIEAARKKNDVPLAREGSKDDRDEDSRG